MRWCAESALAQLQQQAKDAEQQNKPGAAPAAPAGAVAAALPLRGVAAVRSATDEDPGAPGFMATEVYLSVAAILILR